MDRLDEIVRNECDTCGFSAAGVVAYAPLEAERERFQRWLSAGYGADMGYLARSAAYRHDLRRLFPEVRSVVVTLTSYRRPPAVRQPEGVPRIARFAWGRDYHDVLKRNMRHLLDAIRRHEGFAAAKGRAVVDSAPAFERAWAVRAGLGWMGRSSMVVHPRSVVVGRPAAGRLRPADRRAERLRQLQPVYGSLSHRRNRRTPDARCASVPLLPDHRTSRSGGGRVSCSFGRTDFRLRPLHGGLPV